MITAMYALGEQLGSPRTIAGTQIPHPCGSHDISPEQDFAMRREILATAIKAIQTGVDKPTLFRPRVTVTAR